MSVNSSTEKITDLKPVPIAAGAQAFGLIAAGDTAADGGMLLSEEQMNNINNSLSTQATEIESLSNKLSKAIDEVARLTTALETAEAATTVANLNTQIIDLTAERDEAATNATTLQQQVDSLTTENTSLKEQVENGGKPSGTGTSVTTNADANNEEVVATEKPKWYKPDGSEKSAARYSK